MYVSTWWWTAVGFAGNILFGSRFLFQWLESERKKSLVVPAYFWQLSFWGSVLNLFYAIHLDSAPLLLGAVALPFIYARNIVLSRRTTKPAQVEETKETREPAPRPAISTHPAQAAA